MKSTFFSILLLAIITNVYPQNIFDIHTKSPVPLALVYSKTSNFQTQSNINGHIDTFNLNLVPNNDSIYIQHLSYESMAILKAKFKNADSIFLQPKIYEFKEFVITGKKGKQLQKFKVHYRARLWNNNIPKYYIDGKAEYFTKAGTSNFKRFYQQTRNFANTELVEAEKNRGTMASFTALVPLFTEQYLPANFVKKHNLKVVKIDSSTATLQTEDNQIVGQIVKDSTYIKYSISNFALIGKTRHALKTEVITKKFNVEMVFRNLGQDIFDTKNCTSLSYQKIYSTFWVKHDKDKKHKIVSQMSELYVEQIEYLDYNKLKDYPSVSKNKSTYTYPFWLSSECIFYENIDESFLNDLTELK